MGDFGHAQKALIYLKKMESCIYEVSNSSLSGEVVEMDQATFSELEHDLKKRRTRREPFLAKMDRLIPWERLERPIHPFDPKEGRGRRPYPLGTMLRVHCVQLFYNVSDPGMEDLLYEVESVRRSAGLRLTGALPDETTILNFRHLLERHSLGEGLFGAINAHLASQGHRLKTGTIVDVTHAHLVLHGGESEVRGDAGYQGVHKRPEHQGREVDWQVAMRPGWRRRLDKASAEKAAEKRKASIRAKVEHPFLYVKRHFGYSKVRYRGLAKNTQRITMLLGFTNLLIAGRYAAA